MQASKYDNNNRNDLNVNQDLLVCLASQHFLSTLWTTADSGLLLGGNFEPNGAIASDR